MSGIPQPGKSGSKPKGGSAKTVDNRIRRFTVEAARLLHDLHFEQVVVLDVRGKSDVMDYIVIATGTSDRQIRSVGDTVAELGEEFKMTRFGREVDEASSWLVLDFVQVVIHLFDPAARHHYDLEMLWGDAKRVPWRRRKTSTPPNAPSGS